MSYNSSVLYCLAGQSLTHDLNFGFKWWSVCVCVCSFSAFLPDGWSVPWRSWLIQEHPLTQILVEVSTLHVLGDHAEGVAAHTHTQQADDVGVLEPGQDLHLLQEVVPAQARAIRRSRWSSWWWKLADCLPFALATQVNHQVNVKLIKCTYSQTATSATLKVQSSTVTILHFIRF